MGLDVKCEETSFAVVVVIFSIDVVTELVVEDEETANFVEKLNKTKLVALFIFGRK